MTISPNSSIIGRADYAAAAFAEESPGSKEQSAR